MFLQLIIFGSPLMAILCGWVILYQDWRAESRRLRALLAMLMVSVSVLLADGVWAYITLVKPLPPQDYSLESWGPSLSLIAIVFAYSSLWCIKLRVLWISLSVSIYIFLLWFLMGITA